MMTKLDDEMRTMDLTERQLIELFKLWWLASAEQKEAFLANLNILDFHEGRMQFLSFICGFSALMSIGFLITLFLIRSYL